MQDTILLMGHGSQDPEGVAEFLALTEAVRAAAPEYRVEAGVLEFWGPSLPSIQQAIGRCVAAGAGGVLAVPILLHNAGHGNEDMPAQIASARARYPWIELRASSPLGIEDSLLEIAEERIQQVEHALGVASPDATAVLLVGRGTTDAHANGDFFKVGRLIWERNRYRLVECCFVSLTAPNVPTGIERCVRLGARRILVMPYFLHTGVLVKRITRQSAAARESHRSVEIAIGEPLGVHAKLVGLILDRVRALAKDRSSARAVTA